MDHIFEQKQKREFLVCPHCHGTGFVNQKKCTVCRGLGVVSFLEDKVLYWGSIINRKSLYFDQIAKIVRAILNVAFLFIAVAGIGLLAYVSYKQDFINLFQAKFWMIPSAEKLFFWVSLLAVLYIVYRFDRELNKKKKIIVPQFGTKPKLISNWEQVWTVDKKYFVDVSDSFSDEAKKVLERAYTLAENLAHNQISSLHIFAALLTSSKIAVIFGRLNINPETVEDKLTNIFTHKFAASPGKIFLADDAQKIVLHAYQEAFHFNRDYVDVTELLYSVVDLPNDAQEDYIKNVLLDLGVKKQHIINVIQWARILDRIREGWAKTMSRGRLRSKRGMDRAMTAIATPVLNSISEDLTLSAKEGQLFPCLGRKKEFDEIFRIMQGSRKPILLVGNSGVGRTALLHGLAQKMLGEIVPTILHDKRLVALSASHLVAGGQFTPEQKLLMLAQEVMKSGNIVLVVESLDNLVDAQSKGAGLGLGDVLSQFLERRAFYMLATTTPENYKNAIEGTGLGEQFEVVNVGELEMNDAIQVLEVKSSIFENEQKVFFSYQAIARAAELASKYLHDSYLPENALSILSEVAVRVREQKGEKAIISAEDVSTLVSEKTKIPLANVTEGESEKLLHLEERIHKRLIGQDVAVKMVADSLRRARAELRDETRPIASLMFLGPTGVGKTELAKAVAEIYFGNEKNMVRLDMSEFQEQSSIARFIGAAKGTAGYKEGGYLTEAIRKRPFSLVLVDEIEKAHPDILNLFLQIMEDGRLTDNLGRTVSFANTIIIMTSNANADFVQEQIRANVSVEQIRQVLINEKLKEYFKPEFLNRLDGLIVFKSLTKADLVKIAGLLTRKVAKNLEKRGIALKVSVAALQEFAEHGYDPVFGARPLRRLIQERVDNSLAKYLLANKLDPRDVVILDAGEQIRVEKAEQL